MVVQPNGPSFQINGNAVTWQSWHFRVGYTPREGLVLYQIGYEQQGIVRPIIYRISLAEIYVPYSLPDPNWIWRAALDVGEYNLGQYAEQLQPNLDVPNNAVFFNEASASDTGSAGGAINLPNAIAMYERDSGSLWDRADPSTLVRDARFGRELVVVATYVIGNYTYSNSYIFRMDGGIDVRVGATGTTLNQGVNSAEEGDQYGTTVTQNISAPSHQHFFNFRIDFDVDGTTNRLVEENTHNVPSNSRNAFVTDDTVITKEQFRDLNQNLRWRIESSKAKNAVGKATAYELQPIDSAVPYSDPGYAELQHAQFAQHQLWATQYRQGELYAAGDYPNQGVAGQGVPSYIASHKDIQGRDLVVWYTTGFTHVPTIEEYPVMTTESIGFALRPSGFFDQNPALDAP
jgi:primary-amine oxidase